MEWAQRMRLRYPIKIDSCHWCHATSYSAVVFASAPWAGGMRIQDDPGCRLQFEVPYYDVRCSQFPTYATLGPVQRYLLTSCIRTGRRARYLISHQALSRGSLREVTRGVPATRRCRGLVVRHVACTPCAPPPCCLPQYAHP